MMFFFYFNCRINKVPLISYFNIITPFPVPPKREALLSAPSPVGEGWVGGIKTKIDNFIPDSLKSLKY